MTVTAPRISSAAGLAAALAGWIGFVPLLAPPEARAQTAQATTPVTCGQIPSSPNFFPPAPTQIDASCAALPIDVPGGSAQGNVDLFAWLSFVAVNWPVDPATCTADKGVSILSAPVAPVWLTYASDTSVFVPAGQVPAPWCPQGVGAGQAAQQSLQGAELRLQALAAQRAARVARLPEKVRALAEAHPQVSLFLSHNAKGAGLLHDRMALAGADAVPVSGILQATGQPVVDQNGRFARYSVFMNDVEYAYLTANDLWTKAGQQKVTTISFPASSKSTGALGSMEVKAAWKVLGAGDDASRFLTQTAIVYNDEDSSPSPGPNPVTVGLAGLHLVRKTQSQPNWVWATFEQVDNTTRSFANPACTTCVANQPPTLVPYRELDATGKPLNPPTQVVPVIQPDGAAISRNPNFQGLLQGTPFAFYQLISAQWLGETLNPNPVQLGNSVIETYVKPGAATYGCVQCHTGATASPSNKASDHSFIINAQQ
ncbi:hypothetical protein ASG52_16650 [Methylobacterium sp. Leaf456]|uniref:hypothetical protein n=1 Tax=Methylobacterium sp. Leaf456 TaxID=1736382 RepID=UPI0007003C83|nr:hypothetical protein [Methylobacterium sp. Leaf456]KQT60874.1 hypothetical protein ASG52_16650 [Methylobacterium sp. Leaf456]